MKTASKIAAALALTLAASVASAGTLDISVDGVTSWDGEGSGNNTIIIVELEAPATITGIGWDVTLTTSDNGSWLSEMVVSFGPVGGPADVFVTPSGTGAPGGPENYSSGGILDLTDNGISDIFLANGMLQLEFFESFDDVPNDIDGFWAGMLTIECEGDCQVAQPAAEPGMLVLFGLGLLGFAAARRRS